jgi:hypothetical protein
MGTVIERHNMFKLRLIIKRLCLILDINLLDLNFLGIMIMIGAVR